MDRNYLSQYQLGVNAVDADLTNACKEAGYCAIDAQGRLAPTQGFSVIPPGPQSRAVVSHAFSALVRMVAHREFLLYGASRGYELIIDLYPSHRIASVYAGLKSSGAQFPPGAPPVRYLPVAGPAVSDTSRDVLRHEKLTNLLRGFPPPPGQPGQAFVPVVNAVCRLNLVNGLPKFDYLAAVGNPMRRAVVLLVDVYHLTADAVLLLLDEIEDYIKEDFETFPLEPRLEVDVIWIGHVLRGQFGAMNSDVFWYRDGDVIVVPPQAGLPESYVHPCTDWIFDPRLSAAVVAQIPRNADNGMHILRLSRRRPNDPVWAGPACFAEIAHLEETPAWLVSPLESMGHGIASLVSALSLNAGRTIKEAVTSYLKGRPSVINRRVAGATGVAFLQRTVNSSLLTSVQLAVTDEIDKLPGAKVVRRYGPERFFALCRDTALYVVAGPAFSSVVASMKAMPRYVYENWINLRRWRNAVGEHVPLFSRPTGVWTRVLIGGGCLLAAGALLFATSGARPLSTACAEVAQHVQISAVVVGAPIVEETLKHLPLVGPIFARAIMSYELLKDIADIRNVMGPHLRPQDRWLCGPIVMVRAALRSLHLVSFGYLPTIGCHMTWNFLVCCSMYGWVPTIRALLTTNPVSAYWQALTVDLALFHTRGLMVLGASFSRWLLIGTLVAAGLFVCFSSPPPPDRSVRRAAIMAAHARVTASAPVPPLGGSPSSSGDDLEDPVCVVPDPVVEAPPAPQWSAPDIVENLWPDPPVAAVDPVREVESEALPAVPAGEAPLPPNPGLLELVAARTGEFIDPPPSEFPLAWERNQLGEWDARLAVMDGPFGCYKGPGTRRCEGLPCSTYPTLRDPNEISLTSRGVPTSVFTALGQLSVRHHSLVSLCIQPAVWFARPAATVANSVCMIRARLLAAVATPTLTAAQELKAKIVAYGPSFLSGTASPAAHGLNQLFDPVPRGLPAYRPIRVTAAMEDAWLAKFTGNKLARNRAALKANREQGFSLKDPAVRTVTLFAKTDETLFRLENGAPSLRPRAISQLDARCQAYLGPAVHEVAERLAQIWDYVGPSLDTVIAPGSQRIRVNMRVTYAYAPTASKLTTWMSSVHEEFGLWAMRRRGCFLRLIVAGDDHLVLFCKGHDPLMFLEGDVSMCDQCQSRHTVARDVKVYHSLGLPQHMCDMLLRLCTSPMVLNCARKKLDMRFVVHPHAGIKLTGGPDTACGTTICVAHVVLLAFSHLWDFRVPLDQLAAQYAVVCERMGFKMKVRVCPAESYLATFLKGWWVPDEAGCARWTPLPGRILKVGIADGDVVTKYKKVPGVCDQLTAMRYHLRGVASGFVGAYLTPPLSEFVRAWADGQAVAFPPPYQVICDAVAAEPFDREEFDRMVRARYAVTLADLEQVGAWYGPGFLPRLVHHAALGALAAVDYA